MSRDCEFLKGDQSAPKEKYTVTVIKRKGEEITALFTIKCFTKGFAAHLCEELSGKWDEVFWCEQ